MVNEEEVLFQLQNVSEILDKLSSVSEAACPLLDKFFNVFKPHITSLNKFLSSVEVERAERLNNIYNHFRITHNYEHSVALSLTELYIDYFDKPETSVVEVSNQVTNYIQEEKKTKQQGVLELLRQQQNVAKEKPSSTFGRKF